MSIKIYMQDFPEFDLSKFLDIVRVLIDSFIKIFWNFDTGGGLIPLLFNKILGLDPIFILFCIILSGIIIALWKNGLISFG